MPVPGVRLTVVVVTRPVRASPTTRVLTGAFHERSTNRTASSPTFSTRWVLNSCIRRSRHPAYQFAAVSNVVRAALSLTDSSEIWTAERAGSPFSFEALKRRIRVSPPPGSAFRAWRHGTTMPVPEELSEVRPSDQSRLAASRVTWSAVSRSSADSTAGGAATGLGVAYVRDCCWSSASAGRTLPPWVTSTPLTTRAATVASTPTEVWVRRRAAPARRMIGARGSCASSTCTRSGSRVRRASLEAMPRWRAYVEVAVCSARSAVSRGSPTSRAISASEPVVSNVSSITFRWTRVSLPRASRVAVASGSRPLFRCHTRAVCRRWACAHACGRTEASGSSSRDTLRQWCQATTKASRTAARDAGRSPVSA